MSDRRYIDEALGVLAGEASGQKSGGPAQASEAGAVLAGSPTYYDLPLLKQPVWIWSVPAYLYTGGVAGAAMTLGAAAQIAGGWQLRPLVHKCRWIGAAGGALSAVLLIHDLGRPERFLYMLRVFRPTSPMSVGSWVLTFFGGLAGAAAVCSKRGGMLGLMGDAAGIGAGLLGMPLASYTSVLLSNSAVSVWQEARRTMPFLFIGSGISGAAAVLDLMPLSDGEERVVNTFAVTGALIELAGMAAVNWGKSKDPQRKLLVGRGLWQAAKVLSAASLAVSLIPSKRRSTRRMRGVLGTLAALCVRFGIFQAGKQSAADPKASFVV